MTFKPKKQQIHVPGYGVVQKEDFSQVHFNALMKRAGDNRDAFIKQHFVVDSYGDQPLFADEGQEQTEKEKAKAELQKQKAEEKAEKERIKAEEKAQKEAEKLAKKQAEEEAELQKLMEEEEKEKEKNKSK